MLLKLKQKEEEMLTEFVTLFSNEIRGVVNYHLLLVIQTFMMGLKPFRFFLVAGGKAIDDSIRSTLDSQSIHCY